MYRISVYKVMLVKDGNTTAPKNIISNPAEAHEVAQSYLAGLDREHFAVILLNTKNRVIGINTVSVGTLNSSLVHPREVFKPAIVGNAAMVILAHNHPSGDPTPSREDVEVTRRLVEAGKILGIEVLDHIIIGEENYYSLKEKGLM